MPRRRASASASIRFSGAAAGREGDQRVALVPVGDHLALEDLLDADVVGDRGQDRRVLGQVDGGPGRPPACSVVAEVGDDVHRVGGRATVAEREQLAAGLEAAAQRGCGPVEDRRVAVQRRFPELADLLRLEQDRAAHVVEDGVEIGLLLGEERIEEARGAGVVGGPLRAALEQAAVVEEDVDELPEHVVEGLDQLLADEGVVDVGDELPGGAAGGEGDRLAPALPGKGHRARGCGSRLARLERDHRVAVGGESAELHLDRATLGADRDRRQRPLADDHRMDELDRDVSRVGARGRRRADRQQPSAAREAGGELMAAASDPLRLALEEPPVRLAAELRELADRARCPSGVRRRAGAHPCGRRRVSERTRP